jgi:hypothetical protein
MGSENDPFPEAWPDEIIYQRLVGDETLTRSLVKIKRDGIEVLLAWIDAVLCAY